MDNWDDIVAEFNDLSVINWREQSIQMGLLRLCNMPGNPSLSSTLIDMEVAYRDQQFPNKTWQKIEVAAGDKFIGLRLVTEAS